MSEIHEGMDRDDLRQLSKEQLIELVLQLQQPEKTSRTSSRPPSTDKKAKRESARPGGAKPGHEPHNRRLAEDPDEVRDHKPDVCEECGGTFASDAAMELVGEYDEIEIPPVKPHVIRHRRFACRCAQCGAKVRHRPDGTPLPMIAVPVFGYKSHISIDSRFGFIRESAVTSASAADGRQLRRLVSREN